MDQPEKMSSYIGFHILIAHLMLQKSLKNLNTVFSDSNVYSSVAISVQLVRVGLASKQHSANIYSYCRSKIAGD